MCSHIAELMKEFSYPFYYPITYDDGNLSTPKLAIKLGVSTRQGNLSRKGQASAFIEHCPFCGEKVDQAGK